MRIYKDFKEAHGEILRDVVEMGIIVKPKTMQDKYIEGNPDYQTKEVQNYGYVVTGPDLSDLNPNQPWADKEFYERVSPYPINPGEAWKHRREVWTEFLHAAIPGDGYEGPHFGYSYSERFSADDGLERIIQRIKEDPDSRQLYLSVWNPADIEFLGGKGRVPCSLGYLFQVRDNQLNMTYSMRSCDVFTHFHNDVYLAFMLQKYVAERTLYPTGNFTHFINSLHIYQKDAVGIF